MSINVPAEITQIILNELFTLSENLLFWKTRPLHHFGGDDWMMAFWNSKYADKKAGTVSNKGYLIVRFTVSGRSYRIFAHRLIWMLHYGKWPVGILDHINQNKLDNDVSNLRDVGKTENAKNCKRSANNTSGVTGVHWHKRDKRWHARCDGLGGRKFIGSFGSIEEATDAVKAYRLANGFTTQHGSEAMRMECL